MNHIAKQALVSKILKPNATYYQRLGVAKDATTSGTYIRRISENPFDFFIPSDSPVLPIVVSADPPGQISP